MITPRYHLVEGYLKVKSNVIKNENAQAETNPGFSVFKRELTIKKMNITKRLVRITISIEGMALFI